jgi:hypothetical protein
MRALVWIGWRMTISIYGVGRFKEVVFVDAENEELRVTSGLLDDDEAAEMAERLRVVADNLSQARRTDENQTALPFYPSVVTPGIFLGSPAEKHAATG